MTAPLAPRRASRQNARGGFVLIAVLWILVALAGLVGAYVAYAVTMAQNADFYLRRVGAEAAVSGALELAVYDLVNMDQDRRPDEGVLDYRIGDVRAQVHYASEAMRLDLNKASLASLTTFFAAEGGNRASAEIYAQRVIAWREKADGPSAGMEDLSYRAAGVSYRRGTGRSSRSRNCGTCAISRLMSSRALRRSSPSTAGVKIGRPARTIWRRRRPARTRRRPPRRRRSRNSRRSNRRSRRPRRTPGRR